MSIANYIFEASHRATTSTRWHFAFALFCHGNETRAPIANLPNSAQLGGNSTIPSSYIRVRAIVWECGEGHTRTHTYTDARGQYTFRFGYASREM